MTPRTVRIGEKDLRVLPLNLKALKGLAAGGHIARLQNVGAMPDAEQIESVVAILTAAFSRVDASVTAEWIEEHVTIDALGPVLEAVLEESGFKPKEAGKSPNVESP